MLRTRSLLQFILLIGSFAITIVHAAPSPKEELFQKGLAAYQNKQYAEAREDFQKELDQAGESPGVLNDLALTAYHMDQKPLALALWRKALSVSPGYRPARAGRDFLESKMNMRPLERDSFSLWSHRELEALSFTEVLWLNAVILGIFGWLLLRYLGERSAALEEERALPDFPTLPIAMGVVLLLSMGLVGLKAKDVFTERATVTGAKVTVRSLPTDEGVQLFDISGGSEVLVRREQSGWTQVQNGEGASGWIKNSDLYVTSER